MNDFSYGIIYKRIYFGWFQIYPGAGDFEWKILKLGKVCVVPSVTIPSVLC